MLNLDKTPYLLDPESEQEIVKQIKQLEERVSTLRASGKITEDTLKQYYGEKRFEQVAESNAIEGSTLSVGETELAVLKGITITGHDPAYIRDAIALDNALSRLTEMAKDRFTCTNHEQVKELHQLILGDRPHGGLFRSEPVIIRGSEHRPPKTWKDVMDAMDNWEAWSKENKELPAIVRGTILHAWLAHIHPFLDGNGRTSRSITNLELVRAGYPPIIIRKKERERYIDSLSESDSGGDIRSFFELIIERVDGALTGLELSAKAKQDFNPIREKIKKKQESNLQIWNTSVSLLAKSIEHYIREEVEDIGGTIYIKHFESSLDIEDYISLTQRKSVSNSWCFIINIHIPGLEKFERLAYISYRQPEIQSHMKNTGGPAIFWSKKNYNGYPKWISDDNAAPFCLEMTSAEGIGDLWSARLKNNSIIDLSTTELAKKISTGLLELISPSE